ncbi:periplasmic binding protein-like II [Anaeromyces robustus]|uniref:Periplasmic binding protein-like II n=1 Tax=Anaeromyces robustus TaxID=1754192 RepID=A0A1Y1X6V1_9FUNG|nr:periplasmic binding protein-like II [Anaeromyces robustus]|eukprot:ORX81116.1 periplasmic binding protein-like II [Anaeromyces robustus]
MVHLLIFFYLLLCLHKNGYSKSIDISAITFSYFDNDPTYKPMIDSFNEYSLKNNLNITVDLITFTSSNSTFETSDYGSYIENILNKKLSKYDIIFYDNLYTNKYGYSLVDLYKYLEPNHINIYNKNILSQSCSCENKLVGMPATINIDSLYSNMKLLDKYNKTIPKTWNELFETSKYILNEEEKLNNTDLVPFNGLICDDEYGTISILEYIYSYRDSVDAPFPEYQSKAAINAANMLKKIKTELKLDETFYATELFTMTKLFDENAIFIKYWDLAMSNVYHKSIVPGSKEGISSSIIGGYNVGINKYSNENNIQAAVEVIKYISSKEMQKKLVINNITYSGITDLYDEEEICSVVDCKYFKSIQLIGRPIHLVNDYNSYSYNIRNTFFKFLYGDEKAETVLKKIDDITRIYNIPYNSTFGLICIILYGVIGCLFLLSLIFLFFSKFNFYFEFLPISSWIIFILGLIIIIITGFVEIGDKMIIKCHMKVFLISIGFTLNVIPILQQLIFNFPDESEIINWLKKHQFLLLFIFLSKDIILNLLLYIFPYDIELRMVKDGENYKKCKINNSIISKFLILFIVAIPIFVILIILFLCFIEWNVIKIKYDIRFLTYTIYIDTVLLVFLIIIRFNLNNHRLIFMTSCLIYFSITLTNYFFLYGIRIILALLRNENSVLKFITKINNDFINNEDLTTRTHKSCTSKSTDGSEFTNLDITKKDVSSSSVLKKILNYHYQTGIESTDGNHSYLVVV